MIRFKYIVFIFSFLFVLGCASHREVASSDSVRTQYIHLTDTLLHHDSTYVHDSVFFAVHGDTVLQYKWRTEYRDRLVYRNHTDTVLNTDTLVRTVVETREVEKPLSFIQKTSSIIGTIVMCILIVGILSLAIRKTIEYHSS